MASSSLYRSLLATVKTELAAGRTAPHQRTELFRVLDVFLPDFQSFLVFPGPRAEDRAQVSNSPPTPLESQDIQTALRLSDDFNLNEVYCASLVISTLEKDRGQIDIMGVSAGLWFIERDSLIMSLQLLLNAVALDNEFDSDFIAEIQVYIKKFLDAGIRQRIMNLIKELNEEEPIGIMDHDLEPSIKDSTGTVVDRHSAIQKTRLSLCHCMYLSGLIYPLNPQELKDLYNLLKLCSGEGNLPRDATQLRITYTIMFTLTNALVSGAQGTQQAGCMLAHDASFCQEFQLLIMDSSEFSAMTEGFTGIIRLAWVMFRTLNKEIPEATATGCTLEDNEIQCLNRVWEHDMFGFLNAQVFETAAFQNDDKVSAFKFTTSLCNLTTNLFSLPAGRQKIMELKYTSMMALDVRKEPSNSPDQCVNGQAQTLKVQFQPLVSFLYFARGIFQRGSELVINNTDLWKFVYFAGEGHTSHFTLVAFLDMLSALAECKEGAGKVYYLFQKQTVPNLGWQKLFSMLVAYDQQLQLCMDSLNSPPVPFQEGDARVVEAYLKVLEKVIEKGDALERMQWFEDIEPLFKLLPRENVPPFLKGALRNAIAACASVSSVMKEKVCCLLAQHDLPVLNTRLPTDGSGQLSTTQEYDLTYELNDVETRQMEYPSTISYLKLRNFLAGHEFDTKSGRYFEIFQFVRDQVFGLHNQRLYANPVEKWELVVAALHHFEIILSNYGPSEEDARNKSENVLGLEHSLTPASTSSSAAKSSSATPAMELMKDLNSGEIIYSNVMSVLMLGVKSVSEQRGSELYGPVLEEAVSLSFQIFIHAFLKESFFAKSCPASNQPLHEIIFQDFHKVVTLLEYVRYDKSQLIQRHSVKVFDLFSERVPQLVSLLQKADAVLLLTEGYAACLEARFLEAHPSENPDEDIGTLILRILLVNLCKPPPNLTHLLLGFDVNQPAEKTLLQPDRHFSCLSVILLALDTLARPEVNAGLHELGFKLLCDLCVDPITCQPMVDLLRNGKYDFLPKKTSQSSHDTSLERGISSISGTDPSLSEAQDLEMLTCVLEPIAEIAPEIPSTSKPELGFLNPEPLATRCTSKETDGSADGGVGALRSSWIQRLFPGMPDASAKPPKWKGKEKLVASDDEETDRLLIENTGKLPEGLGSSSPLSQGREIQHVDNRRPGIEEDGGKMDLVYPCSGGSRLVPLVIPRQGLPPTEQSVPQHDMPRQVDPAARHDQGTTQLGKDPELAKKSDVSSIPGLKPAPDVEMWSMQTEPHLVQPHSVTLSNVPGRSQQQERSRQVLDGLGSSNTPVLQTDLPSSWVRNPQSHPGGRKSFRDVDRSPAGGGDGAEHMNLGDDLPVYETNEYRAQHDADKTQNVVPSGGVSPLPPLSLFAPFKHSKERRSALAQGGKPNVAAQAVFPESETPMTTPLFPSHAYPDGTNGMQGGAVVPEEKFNSTIFAPYRPSSSLHPSSGLGHYGTPLTLKPIFAPFKTSEEHIGPSTFFVETVRMPVDLAEQGGKDTVMQDNIGLNSNTVSVDANGTPVELQRGQSSHQWATHGCPLPVSNYNSRSSLPVVTITGKRKAAIFSSSSIPRFNEGLSRVGTANVRKHSLRSPAVDTSAIELSSTRPSLQYDGVRCDANVNNPARPPSHRNVDLSVSQGMKEIFQYDQGLQPQRLHSEAEIPRELRPFSSLMCEPSSGSSPIPAGAVAMQVDGLKAPDDKGKTALVSPSASVKDASRDQVVADREPRGGSASFNVAAHNSVGLLSRRSPLQGTEEPSFVQGRNVSVDPAHIVMPGRSSRKRSHDARTSDTPLVARNSAPQSQPASSSLPQVQPSVKHDSRATPPSQSWLNRWMPSSKPAGTLVKAPGTGGLLPGPSSSSQAKNRRLVQEPNVIREQMGDIGPEEQRTHVTQTADPWASHNSDFRRRTSNPLFPGSYPIPSAAAMALVGAASRRPVPLPPQRVGARMAVWPAIAEMQLRRAESETTEVLTLRMEGEEVAEEG